MTGRTQLPARAIYGIVGGVLLVVAVPLWVYTVHRTVWPADPGRLVLPVLLLTAAFIAVEFLPLRIEVRRETTMLTLTEIPLVVGLLAGIPAPLVGAANLLAAMVVFLIRRDSWRYLAINLVFVLTETAVTASIYITAADASSGWRYLALFVGCVTSTVLSSVAISVIHRMLGTPDPLGPALARSIISTGATTTFAMVGFVLCFPPTDSDVLGKVLCVALAVAVGLLWWIYERFLRQHIDLTRMYEFGRQVSTVGSDVEDLEALLEHIRDQLNARLAVVHLTEPDASAAIPMQSVAVGADGPVDEPLRTRGDLLMREVDGKGTALQVSARRSTDQALARSVAMRGAVDILVAPLGSGSTARGYLEVRDRQSRWGRFSANDLRLLETHARTMATALDRQRLLETLRHEAHHDAITGLLNWRGAIGKIGEGLAVRRISGLVLLELGILSQVTNAVGHDRGEQLLITAGRRLQEALNGTLQVARLEMDRFGVLVEDLPAAEVEQVALHLLDQVSHPLFLDGVDVEPRPKVGIALVQTADDVPVRDAEVLMQRAEMALAAAAQSDDSMRFYGIGLGEGVRRRFQLVTQFRRAIDQGLITVHYQPKVGLSDRELVGVEALVRWAHPEFGAVSPAEFIDAIETTGFIDVLFEHVLDIVLAQIAEWLARNIRIGVAVNVSARNLTTGQFSSKVAQALHKYRVPASLLIFEITESSVMTHPERTLPILRQLHAMGIGLSVDDFGTGYSSLAYLRRLPIDEIKIDKSFVQGMVTDKTDLNIVRAIIDLGHSLDLRVVAEGAEQEDARAALRSLGCDVMQGFLLSRPLPIEKLEKWLLLRTDEVERADRPPHTLRITSA